jgi:hypothetical protein
MSRALTLVVGIAFGLGLAGWLPILATRHELAAASPTQLKLRYYPGALSPTKAHDWAIRVKAWFDKADILINLVDADKWEMDAGTETGTEFVSSSKIMLAALKRSLGRVRGSSDQLIKEPYRLSNEDTARLEILNVTSEFDQLNALAISPGFKGAPSLEILKAMVNHSSEGYNLLTESSANHSALIWSYEESGLGVPAW